jgi:hypothetical protein
MQVELDHLFVCSAVGAPEAKRLIELGFREGSPNQHPGQGTANRRFEFANAMLELLWVSDPKEVQSPSVRRTSLWERWSGRQGPASPFGICLRPVDSQESVLPYPGWDYHPSYLEDSLSIHIGDAGIEEPLWDYLGFMFRLDREQQFREHPNDVREVTGLTLITPAPLTSPTSQRVIELGILSTRTGTESLLEVEFDNHRQHQRADLRPHLPLIMEF